MPDEVNVGNQSSGGKEEYPSQYVVFKIDNEEYGVKLTDLKEIIKIPELTPIPRAPDFFAGVFNLRGRIIPVIDLEKRFSMKREKPQIAEHVIIAEQKNDLYGMIVDEMVGTIKIPQSEVKRPQAAGVFKLNEAYIDGIATPEAAGKNGQRNRLIIILNIHKILSPQELVDLAKTTNDSAKKDPNG